VVVPHCKTHTHNGAELSRRSTLTQLLVLACDSNWYLKFSLGNPLIMVNASFNMYILKAGREPLKYKQEDIFMGDSVIWASRVLFCFFFFSVIV